MIKINFYIDGFTISGHANYADHGSDIVCAAISSIALTSVSWFCKEDIILYLEDEQKAVIKFKVKLNQKNIDALSLIKHQLNQVYQSYSKYISVKNYSIKLKE